MVVQAVAQEQTLMLQTEDQEILTVGPQGKDGGGSNKYEGRAVAVVFSMRELMF